MKKNIFYWVLYDFGNSFLSAALEGLYFSQWVIIDNKFPDIWYSAAFSIATLLLLVTAPFLGAWSDHRKKRLPFLKISTLLIIMLGILLGVISNSYLPSYSKVIFALVVFSFIQYFYQASLTFYNPLLDQLSTLKTRGLISGIGQLANNLGFVVATGVFLYLVQSKFTLIGDSGRSQVFIPATILFACLSLPMLFKFKERNKENSVSLVKFNVIFFRTINSILNLFSKEKNVGLFLIAFIFISDAILTANLFFAIYMDQVYSIPDSEKFKYLAVMSLITIPSCYIAGWLGDRLGLKKILLFSCFILMTSFLLISFLSSSKLLIGLMAFVGIGWGGYYATARALLINISPKDKLSEYFGFYSTFQKFASIIGPLTWGGITLLLVNYGIIRYRVAIVALVVFMGIGTFLLTKVQEKRI